MLLGYVCTNYNNSEYTRDAVRTLVAGCPDCRIAVVDNDSNDECVADLRRVESEFENVDLVLSGVNVGYFRGLNKGIAHLRRRYPQIEYMVIGNNDLVFPRAFHEDVESNLATLRTHPVISPDIVTADDVHQNPHVIEMISWPRELIYDLYYTSYPLALMISKIARISNRFTDRKDESRWKIGGPIYQGHGACYILGPLFFEYFERLWAPTFLMGEEFFLSKQLADRGLRVYYEPGIRVVHQYHATVDKLPRKRMWAIARDAHKVYRRYVGIFGPKADRSSGQEAS